MRRFPTAIILFLALARSAGAADAAGTAVPMASDLAFISQPQHNFGHMPYGRPCLLHGSTGAVEDLAAGADIGGVRHLTWSCDGQCLVFESSGDIYAVQIAGRVLRRLTDTGDCFEPACHPQKPVIWYVRQKPITQGGQGLGEPARNTIEVWRMDLQGQGKDLVCSLGKQEAEAGSFAKWHPSGAYCIVDLSGGGDAPWTQIVRTSGTASNIPADSPWYDRAVPDPWPAKAYAWPSGLCCQPGNDNSRCRSNVLVDMAVSGDVSPPPIDAWSIDTFDGKRWHTILRESNVTGRRSFPQGASRASWPDWSPDGGLIAFDLTEEMGDGGHSYSIWMVPPGGGKAALLLRNACQPAWRSVPVATPTKPGISQTNDSSSEKPANLAILVFQQYMREGPPAQSYGKRNCVCFDLGECAWLPQTRIPWMTDENDLGKWPYTDTRFQQLLQDRGWKKGDLWFPFKTVANTGDQTTIQFYHRWWGVSVELHSIGGKWQPTVLSAWDEGVDAVHRWRIDRAGDGFRLTRE